MFNNDFPQSPFSMFPIPRVDTTTITEIVDFTSTNNRIFKYKIGDRFLDKKFNDTVEITGYNNTFGCYEGRIEMNFGKKTITKESNVIYESRLDSMVMLGKKTDKKEDVFTYNIYYFEGVVKKAKQHKVELSNIKALAKLLNSWVKINPKRKIVLVTLLDENGIYVGNVKFLKQEMKEQKFLTGMKERLLAHAKYECGYEVATNF
jgi:hypothetical protein